MSAGKEFVPLNLCVLTVSDTRSLANDSSGDYLAAALAEAGHRLHERALLPDNRYLLRARVSAWIADEGVDGILVTGGTGFTGRDSTPEALLPLLDKQMPGFGEVFRALSFEEIGASTIQSRAFAGLARCSRQVTGVGAHTIPRSISRPSPVCKRAGAHALASSVAAALKAS